MRRLIFASLTALSLAFALPARAEQATVYGPADEPRPGLRHPNMLLINPGDLFNGVLSVEYERALAPWFGLTVGMSVLSFRGPFLNAERPYYTALSPSIGARFHFIREAPGGLWIGPTIGAGYLLASSEGALARNWQWSLGAALGYNFIIGRHFTFQLGAGGGFTDRGNGDLDWQPRLLLGLGAVF